MFEEDLNYQEFKTISDITDAFTFEATSINVDYLLTLQRNNTGFLKKQVTIHTYFADIFNELKNYYQDEDKLELKEFIFALKEKFIKNNALKEYFKSQNSFDYCIILGDRFLPLIPKNLLSTLESYYEKIDLARLLYLDNLNNVNDENNKQTLHEIEENYFNIQSDIKSELCKFLALWIHAYRIEKAYDNVRADSKNLTFSHRFYGWHGNNEIYKINDNLKVEFNSNFGYGDSSYFYIVLYFKDLKIFPFMDWTNYKYANASKMRSYTKRLHEAKIGITENGRRKDIVEIHQEDWDKGMDYLVLACNLAIQDEKQFIETYIWKPVAIMVTDLENIFDRNDDELNREFRSFDYGLEKYQSQVDIKKIKLMNIKGQKIVGSLDFLSEISKLREFMDTEIYINRINDINIRLLPKLTITLEECQKLDKILQDKINNLFERLKEIWLGKGLSQLEKNIRNLNELQLKEYENLKDIHTQLSKNKFDLETDKKHNDILLKNISGYIKKINFKTVINK